MNSSNDLDLRQEPSSCKEQETKIKSKDRRDFMVLVASATAGVGAAYACLPLLSSLNPSKDVLALSTVEVDISNLKPGEGKTVKWRGKPVFIKRRTEEEMKDADTVDISILRDAELDDDRVLKKEWLIMIGVCTHLGCVPLWHKEGTAQGGEFNGWFCPCHGSHYDTSGRVRKGPAPKNLEVPEYYFANDKTVVIGKCEQ